MLSSCRKGTGIRNIAEQNLFHLMILSRYWIFCRISNSTYSFNRRKNKPYFPKWCRKLVILFDVQAYFLSWGKQERFLIKIERQTHLFVPVIDEKNLLCEISFKQWINGDISKIMQPIHSVLGKIILLKWQISNHKILPVPNLYDPSRSFIVVSVNNHI